MHNHSSLRLRSWATGIVLAWAAIEPPAWGQRATLQVAVQTAAGEPIADSLVVPLTADWGKPLLARTGEPIAGLDELAAATSEPPSSPDSPRLLFGYTDRDGQVRFSLPAGSYRLLAIRTPAATVPPTPLGLAGDIVQLDGVSDPLQLAANGMAAVELRPLGSAEWQLDATIPNSDAYLFVSRAPLAADPILGFAGWDTRFLSGLLLAVRLPRGACRIQGLPAGELHAGLFANDNNPGFGAATAQLADLPVHSRIPLVASWSDGHKEPPARLRPLCEKLRTAQQARQAVQTQWRTVLQDAGSNPAASPLQMYLQLQQHLADPVSVDASTAVPFGDAVAALMYIQLADQQRR